jgi:hypothetical protein
MKKGISFIILAFVFMVGCAANNNADNSYSKVQDRDGTRLLSNQPGNAENNQGRNMRNGTGRQDNGTNETRGRTMSDQNPNLLNTGGGRFDNAGVIRHARKTINQTDEFEPGAIWINGDAMWVTVYKNGPMTNDQKIHAEARAHALLTKAFPDYRVEVNVRENRR